MNIHIGRRLFLAAAVGSAAAVVTMGFLIALGVHSVVAEPGSASPAAAPNPGHSWSEIGDLPGTMWHSNNDGPGSGLDADLLDGLQSTQIQDADDYVSNAGYCTAAGNADTLDGQHAGAFWSISGNSGTTGSNFLGTTDSQALELRVNSARALRLEPNATCPNLIGGHSANWVSSGVYGATIAGGGTSVPYANRVTDNYGTVGGGWNNQAGDNAGTSSDRNNATVGGGRYNTASGERATVAGGETNSASGFQDTVGGGGGNAASGGNATVAGGSGNAAGSEATVGGGGHNTANDWATVGGGGFNTASGSFSTVGGGWTNTAGYSYATIGGGEGNTSSDYWSTVAGGYQNTAGETGATVPGGRDNVAGGEYSLAAGRRAKANREGAFVWADSNDFDFASTASNEFSARSTGGARFVSAIDSSGNPTAGVQLAAGGGSWSSISDRNLKENFTPVDGQEVLASLADIPMTTWNYKAQDAAIHHMGPVAQDFYAAFGLGESETAISTVDADGVALAAIQELYGMVQELQAENAGLQQRLGDLDARVTALEGGAPLDDESAGPLASIMPGGWLVLGALLVLGGLVLAQRRLAGGRS